MADETQKAIGPTFGQELAAAGGAGLPFSWDAMGNFFGLDNLTDAQNAIVQAVYAAHDPTKQVPTS